MVKKKAVSQSLIADSGYETPKEVVKTKTLRGKYRILDEYKSFMFQKDVKVPDKFLDQLAEDLIDWARKDDSLKFFQFLDDIGVNDTLFRSWMARNDNLKEAHAWTIRLLGNRRELGAMTGKYREKMVMHTMHQYDPEWKQADEWHFSKLKDANTPEWVELRLNTITVDKKDVE
jgi:hypothetical protein